LLYSTNPVFTHMKYVDPPEPEINQDLFGRIDKQIGSEPEGFNMDSWERVVLLESSATACGTQRCVAGWAIHMVHEDRFGATGKPLRLQLLDLVGFAANDHANPLGYQEYGAEILGLTYGEAGQLFYSPPALARVLVHAYATGGRPAAQAARREYARQEREALVAEASTLP
jgi:hypothetical protein